MTADLRVPLIVVGLLGVIAAARVAGWPLAPIEAATSRDALAGQRVHDAPRSIAAESVSAVVSRDPFRISRRPAMPAYDPMRVAQPAVLLPPRPVLILVGVVNGAEPSAVVEGLPGVEGSRVMRVGDVVAGLQIKQINNGRVVIAGMDTTWVLEVREPWKN